MLVDRAVYREGRRQPAAGLAADIASVRDGHGFVWIGLKDPTDEEFAERAARVQRQRESRPVERLSPA